MSDEQELKQEETEVAAEKPAEDAVDVVKDED